MEKGDAGFNIENLLIRIWGKLFRNSVDENAMTVWIDFF
jgi:hypothetical protein